MRNLQARTDGRIKAVETVKREERSRPEFAGSLIRLQQGDVAWPERVALAHEVCEFLATEDVTESVLGIVYELADDRKGEVRKKIADTLFVLPDQDFKTLFEKLSRDTNSLVQRAALRSDQRRRRGQWTEMRRKRQLDHVAESVAAIEAKFGGDAADRVIRIAERLYHILIGATVHDMKGILTPLKSAAEALAAQSEQGTMEPPITRKLLTRIQGRVRTMERLFDDMQNYTQAGPPLRQREGLADLVKHAHSTVLEVFAAEGRDVSGIESKIDVSENIAVEVSRYQVALALGNLIRNAYESYLTNATTFRPGLVEVSAKVAEDMAVVTVRDGGMGLNREDLEYVLRYVPGNTSKKRYGTGFGLPIARRKIIDNGGELRIESEENKGTTVTITLPLAG